MTEEHFERVLRTFQKRVPFRSYSLELVSGTTIQVDHPEALVLRGGVGVFIDADNEFTLLDHDSVVKVTDSIGQPTA